MFHKNLDSFSKDFLWGASSAAYQIEGAPTEDGKGKSIWDVYSHEKGNTYHGTNGDIAVDHYHRYKEDVALMKKMGLKAYRFSVSWSRVLPKGEGEVNPKGLLFYHSLIDELKKAGIEPVLTMYHWDLPLILQEKYHGWESTKTIAAFTNYAKLLFKEFGTKVKFWVTINEQNVFTSMGYRWGTHPPKKHNFKLMLQVNHHINLANASAIKLFHQMVPDGMIGPSFGYGPTYAKTSDPEDVLASINANDFNNNWWLDVYCTGKYPYFCKKQFEKLNIMPKITKEEQAILEDPEAHPDFLGINYYHGGTFQQNRIQKIVNFGKQEQFDKTDPYLIQPQQGQANEPEVPMFNNVENSYVKKTQWGWEKDPIGLRITLRLVYEKYQLPIMITENGLGALDKVENGKINDSYRISYLADHITAMQQAITDGVNIIGYCAWSFTDLLSWLNGYSKRYGFVYVDQNNHENGSLKRIPKRSYFWYAKVIKTNGADLGNEE